MNTSRTRYLKHIANNLLSLALLLVLSGLLLAGCSEAQPSETVVTEVVVIEDAERVVTRLVHQTVAVTVTPNSEAAAARNQPVALDLSFVGDVPDFDPQTTDDSDGIDLVENLYVGLTNFNHDKNIVEPELATDWDVSADGRVWKFTLRDDLFWVRPVGGSPAADGFWSVEPVRPVDAADVVYAVQRICMRDVGTPDAFILYLIDGCEQMRESREETPPELQTLGVRAVNDFTVEFTLTEPASYFLTITSMWMLHPAPRELGEAATEDWQEAAILTTSGPFFVTPGSTAAGRPVLQRNPLWPLPRKGNVDIVNIVSLNDVMDAYQLWQAKRLDVGPLPIGVRSEFMSLSPSKAKLVTEQTVFYLGFNFESGVLREPSVRRALNAAIDRDVLAEELYGGSALGMRHLSPPGVMAAPPINEIGKGYDPDYARQQMSESGFRSCRLMPPITFLVSTSDQSLQQAELIRQMWIDELDCAEEQIVIEQVQFGTLLANTRKDAGAVRPDVWELGWASYFPDAQNWVGDLLQCQDSENRQSRPCSDVDELIRRAAVETDLEQRQQQYRQIEDMFFGREGIVPMSPLYVPGEYALVQSWLTYTPAYFGGEQWDTYLVAADLKRLERSR